MTLRAWIMELRGRVHEALAPDLAQLREELAQQRTRMNLMRIQLADQNLRISHLTRKGDTRRAEVEKPTTLRPASEWRDDDGANAYEHGYNNALNDALYHGMKWAIQQCDKQTQTKEQTP
jgi:hypothetical protein